MIFVILTCLRLTKNFGDEKFSKLPSKNKEVDEKECDSIRKTLGLVQFCSRELICDFVDINRAFHSKVGSQIRC